MALSLATIQNQLQNLEPTSSASTAISRLASAFGNYMAAATPAIIPGSLAAGAVPAMVNAMSATLILTDAAVELRKGLQGFWTEIVAHPTTYFVGATLVVAPTTYAMGFDSTVQSMFTSNRVDGVVFSVAAQNLGLIIHTATTGWGQVTIPPAGAVPIV